MAKKNHFIHKQPEEKKINDEKNKNNNNNKNFLVLKFDSFYFACFHL